MCCTASKTSRKMIKPNLVPRSLVDEAEGEIWPNPICITWSPVGNVTGEASAHAQHKFGAVKADLVDYSIFKGRFNRYDFVAYNKLTTGLRHDWGILVRISKFRCFHKTKQTQNEVERSFLQLGRICFRILLRQSENFSDFCKVLSQFVFRNMIVPFYTSSSARALKLPSISHTSFFHVKRFNKILPLLPNCYRQISLKRFWYCSRHAVYVRRLGDLVSAKKKLRTGGGFVKFCVKNACVEDGGELECALDDVFRI